MSAGARRLARPFVAETGPKDRFQRHAKTVAASHPINGPDRPYVSS